MGTPQQKVSPSQSLVMSPLASITAWRHHLMRFTSRLFLLIVKSTIVTEQDGGSLARPFERMKPIARLWRDTRGALTSFKRAWSWVASIIRFLQWSGHQHLVARVDGTNLHRSSMLPSSGPMRVYNSPSTWWQNYASLNNIGIYLFIHTYSFISVNCTKKDENNKK